MKQEIVVLLSNVTNLRPCLTLMFFQMSVKLKYTNMFGEIVKLTVSFCNTDV